MSGARPRKTAHLPCHAPAAMGVSPIRPHASLSPTLPMPGEGAWDHGHGRCTGKDIFQVPTVLFSPPPRVEEVGRGSAQPPPHILGNAINASTRSEDLPSTVTVGFKQACLMLV